MDPRFQEILRVRPLPQSPEYSSNHPLPLPEIPFPALSHYAFDQPLESSFSRLSLSQNFEPHSAPSSLFGLPAAASAESVHRQMACGERQQQQPSVWAQSPRINGGVNGPYSFFGAHQKIAVGPDSVGLLGPNIAAAADALEAMKLHQRPDFSDGGGAGGNYQSSSLHGKEPILRNASSQFLASPASQLRNFYNSGTSSVCDHQELTVELMRGWVVALASDQVWSGVLNSKLEKGLTEEEVATILQEAMPFLVDLLRNQFGNLFVQNLFVACNEDQRTRVILALTKFPYKLIISCLNPFGGRAMQKLLEKMNATQALFVVSALSLGVVLLATDPNGQHVIQHCIKNFPWEYNKPLFKEIAKNCFKIATNKSGCCVLQSCVENSDGESKEILIAEIKASALHLAQDPYGNYVVQHLIGLRMQKVTADLVRQFQGYFASLSCNKYASNVVEKFLLESGEKYSTIIIMELLESANASMLLIDPYGNFVIQSALNAAQGRVREVLLNFIHANASSMQSNLYGKKILAWFDKRRPHNM